MCVCECEERTYVNSNCQADQDLPVQCRLIDPAVAVCRVARSRNGLLVRLSQAPRPQLTVVKYVSHG